MHNAMEHVPQGAPEQQPYRDLMDPTPPEHEEVRVDSDGARWRWVPSHHTVARELEIESAGADYWTERLSQNSDDAARDAFDLAPPLDEKAAQSVFAEPAYHWRAID